MRLPYIVTLAFLISITCLSLPSIATLASPSDALWPSPRYDFSNTGFKISCSTLPLGTYNTRWALNNTLCNYSTIVPWRRTYAVSLHNTTHLIMIDATNRTLLDTWECLASATVAVVRGNQIYTLVATLNDENSIKVACFDEAGNSIWQYVQPLQKSVSNPSLLLQATPDTAFVFVDRWCLTLDTTSGQVIACFQLPGYCSVLPALAFLQSSFNGNTSLAIFVSNNTVFAFGEDGSLLWSYSTAASIAIPPIVIHRPSESGTATLYYVIIADKSGCLNLISQGATLWSKHVDGIITGIVVYPMPHQNPLSRTNHLIAISLNNGSLLCLYGDNGSIVWTTSINATIRVPPVALSVGTSAAAPQLIVAAHARVYVLDAWTGCVQGTIVLPHPTDRQLALADIDADSKIEILAVGNYQLICADLETFSPPLVRIVEPYLRQNISSSTINITWVYWDDLGIDRFEVLINNTRVYHGFKHTILLNLTDGFYSLSILAIDVSGLKNMSSTCFRVDTKPPQITIYGLDNETTINLGDTISIRWTVSDNGSGLFYVAAMLNATPVSNEDAGFYEFNATQDGVYVFSIVAYDYAGNTIRASRTLYVRRPLSDTNTSHSNETSSQPDESSTEESAHLLEGDAMVENSTNPVQSSPSSIESQVSPNWFTSSTRWLLLTAIIFFSAVFAAFALVVRKRKATILLPRPRN